MDHIGILKRALHITRRYRVLWIFGALIALFAAGGGGGSGPNFSLPGGQDMEIPRGWFQGYAPSHFDGTAVVGLIVALVCVVSLLALVGAIVSYVSRTALYRMVDQIEDEGSSPTWREGFRLGWSKRTWRLLGIDLAIGIPLVVGSILVLAVAALPLLMLIAQRDALTVLAIVMTVGLGILAIALIIVVSVLANLAMRFMHRKAAIDNLSVGESIVQGYQMLRSNLRDSAVMWLLMLGVSFAWGIVMIPVAIIVLLLAAAIGGVPAYLIWQGTQSPWLTLGVGIPLFLLASVPPMTFLGGLFEVFRSSNWTLTYREFRERSWVAELPADDLSTMELEAATAELRDAASDVSPGSSGEEGDEPPDGS